MKFAQLLPLSARYFVRYRKRYLFLMAALAVGFCVVTVIVSQKNGMTENVYISAQSHYSGDIVFYGRDKDSERGDHLDFGSVSAILKAIDDSGIDYSKVVERTVLYSDTKLFYNGASVPLKYIVGIDWDGEKDYLDGLRWAEKKNARPNENTLFLSEPIAAQLGVLCGDMLLLETETRYGQKNTQDFIVGGIIGDSSIFGFYKVYVDRRTLNKLVEFEDEDCSHLGVFIPRQKDIKSARRAIYEKLKDKINIAPLVNTRDEWSEEKSASWKGIKVFALTLNVYLSEVSQILDALNALTYFLYALMLLIIFVSAAVTCRLILHERTREIGTMRAIGFKGREIRLLFALESFFAASFAIAAGFVFSLLLNAVLAQVSWDWMPSFEIFMKNGHLSANLGAPTFLWNAVFVYFALTAAIWLPARNASREELPLMLTASGTKN